MGGGALCVVATTAVAAVTGAALGTLIACGAGVICPDVLEVVPVPAPVPLPAPGPLPAPADSPRPRSTPTVGPVAPPMGAPMPTPVPGPAPVPAPIPSPIPRADPDCDVDADADVNIDTDVRFGQPTPTPSPQVNLDTGSAVALVSADTSAPAIIARTTVETLLRSSDPIMTRTAVVEFFRQVVTIAGPQERRAAASLMTQVKEVPDDPSDRVRSLRYTRSIKEPDILIFGTGDRHGIITVTADDSFVRAAASQGVTLNAVVHKPVPLTGR